MNYILKDSYRDRPTRERGNSPLVTGKMLSLREYLKIAREMIHYNAHPAVKNALLDSEDAIAFVADAIMVADWYFDPKYAEKKGLSPEEQSSLTTYRRYSARKAIGGYLRLVRKQRDRENHLSLDSQLDGDKCLLHETVSDKRSLEPCRMMELRESQLEALNLIGLLSPTQQKYLRLYCIEGVKQIDIHRQLGVSRQMVSKTIAAGMRKIRIFMGVDDA